MNADFDPQTPRVGGSTSRVGNSTSRVGGSTPRTNQLDSTHGGSNSNLQKDQPLLETRTQNEWTTELESSLKKTGDSANANSWMYQIYLNGLQRRRYYVKWILIVSDFIIGLVLVLGTFIVLPPTVIGILSTASFVKIWFDNYLDDSKILLEISTARFLVSEFRTIAGQIQRELGVPRDRRSSAIVFDDLINMHYQGVLKFAPSLDPWVLRKYQKQASSQGLSQIDTENAPIPTVVIHPSAQMQTAESGSSVPTENSQPTPLVVQHPGVGQNPLECGEHMNALTYELHRLQQ